MSLPSGYKRREYIQSSGTQYIDTGFKPNNNTKVVIDFELTENTGKHQIIFGARSSSNSEQYVLGFTGHRSPAVWRSDFGSNQITFSSNLTWSGNHNATKNGNICTLDAESVTNTASTFESTVNLLICAGNTGGNVDNYTKAKVYFCKIYDNGTLARDFIPCKNASGLVGLWDDVNNTFYSNAGSGTFTAGPEAIGSNRVLVDAKRYDANSGTVLVNGMVYHLKKGRGLLNGMGYDIPFNSGTPISELPVENTVKIAVNGTLRDFLIVHQGLPSSLYDDSCNGTWLLMKDVYETRQWNSSDVNDYANSTIHSYLNSTFLAMFDSNIQNAIKQIKIPYVNGTGGSAVASGANGLSAKIFLLSGYEVGWTTSDDEGFPVDGAKLDYFAAGWDGNSKRIAYLGGSAIYWWLRSPGNNFTNYVFYVTIPGDDSYLKPSINCGIRPAFILPSDTLVSDDGTIIT